MDPTDISPQIDPPEEAPNEDALFNAPPEPDDAIFHDVNADSEDNVLLSTPTQTESPVSIPTLSLPPLSLEERVAHFASLFGDIKEELRGTKDDLRNAQAQASLH